ncbi:MAG: electron transport complex subunit RsxC [Gammaproteobacteria bacterium]|jgi:electron transport complex protein RnfC
MNPVATIRRGFRHGVHPAQYKAQTVDLPIQRLPFGHRYVLPLGQHLGVPAQPVVSPGQQVHRGQLIAQPGGFVSASLHSPVTGRVCAIEPRRNVDGSLQLAIEIEADRYATQHLEPRPRADRLALSLKEFIEELQSAGIVGLGGAAFPTHVKYTMPEGKHIHHLLVNGAECEPYLTNDHRLMVERPAALLRGIGIVKRKLGADRATIGIEINKPEAIAVLKSTIRRHHRTGIAPLQVKYPQGAEKMLIRAIFGVEVPADKLPRDLGIVVNNVGTLMAIADYFDFGMPLIERVITVSGPGVTYPANLIVPIGTPVREVLDFCGGLKPPTRAVVMGGPMMGLPLPSLDVPVVKGTSGILAFTAESLPARREFPCIRCGRCLQACPHFLNPSRLGRLARLGRYEDMRRHFAMDCVECGACTLSCPSGIALTQLIKVGKAKLRNSVAGPT